ncbi:MAG: adenosylmethionine--8-amino-7-oxononanoate transaminase [Bacteroidota bacterium]
MIDAITGKKLTDRDKKHLWHPLTQHCTHPGTIAISKAKGTLLFDEDGNQYIDGIASWYTAMYGHCNDYILDRVTRQMQQLDQVVFSGFTHRPAVELSEALIAVLPENQEKLFFSDNGSTATEIAIKMALQYHFNQGKKKNVLLAFEDGFHGDTFGAMSVSGLSVYNGPFEDFFIKVERIPVPTVENIEKMLQQLSERVLQDNIAAFIYEPLVQGAAGMRMHDSKGLNRILQLLQQYEIITIADEVMTGFGKTGTYFASDQVATKPDIICLSKALTAGLVPMGLTTCSQKIFDAFYSDDLRKGFFHGHTYTANPLACTAALAGVTLLKSDGIQDNIQKIMGWHAAFDSEVRYHPKVASTRRLGVIYALDLDLKMERYGDLRDRLFHHFLAKGVFLRPLGNTIYILPPYSISKSEMHQVYDAIRSAFEII